MNENNKAINNMLIVNAGYKKYNKLYKNNSNFPSY